MIGNLVLVVLVAGDWWPEDENCDSYTPAACCTYKEAFCDQFRSSEPLLKGREFCNKIVYIFTLPPTIPLNPKVQILLSRSSYLSSYTLF